MATFMDWYYKKQGISELTQKDLEGLDYELSKVFRPTLISPEIQMEECHKLFRPIKVDDANPQVMPPLSISKIKGCYYPDVGLEQMVPDQMWIEEECKYDVAADDVVIFTWFGSKTTKTLSAGDGSYQTQLNLTKPLWDAKGFEYKHDFTVIDSLRAVKFRDKYGVQMIMRFNEIHKFSDGTLQQIDEALDYRVKEFRVNRMNLGLDTRFWMKKDVDRRKEFMFAIQKRLKTRCIFQNLESFVGGRIREGDYRLLKRTE
ncbi:hypothetical protein Tco_1036145 [Tanacetum coccineum]